MNSPVRLFRCSHVDFSSRCGRSILLSLAVCLCLLAGCKEEQIHTYTAPKPEPIPSATPQMPGMASKGVAVPTRMLGAILRQTEVTWFFKLTAPPDEAAALREEFGKFVASTRFENGEPSWEIPANWTEERGRMMRFTTYHIGEDGPEVSISTLPNQLDEVETALININRWRGQLGLSELQSADYAKALETDKDAEEILPEDEGEIVSISTPAGKAVLIDFVGEMATGGGPPFANMGRPPAGLPDVPKQLAPGPQTNAGAPRLSPADHWTPGELNQFRVAAYVVRDGDHTADVTLSTAGGDLLPNVNRWRGQVDLPGWTADEFAKKKKTLIGQGYTADYVTLIGPVNAILGAVINHDGKQWFVKLTGPKALAEAERENFENLVKTIEF